MAATETPLMKQYNTIKAKYPDALLLFRVGDFYETFGKDAIIASEILEIVLTKRANGKASHIELAGFPHHSLDTYLPKLVRAGKRVAICDQLEDPKMTKTIVKRGVTEIVTPGVTYHDNVLSQKQNNFLLAIYKKKEIYGMALLDVSTGEFLVNQGNASMVENAIQSYQPKEILLPRNLQHSFQLGSIHVQKQEDWAFQYDYAYEKLTSHFKTNSLKGFGMDELQEGIIAAGAIFAYIVEGTHHKLLDHITQIQKISTSDFVRLDGFTIRNLELLHSSHPEGTSLLKIIDKTQTALGGRMLKRWLLQPLKTKDAIEKRHNIVSFLLKNEALTEQISEHLRQISDVERMVGKLASGKIHPKELGVLRHSLQQFLEVEKIISKEKLLSKNFDIFKDISASIQVLETQLQEELPVSVAKGNVIQSGISTELDEYRALQNNAQEFLDNLQLKESENTQIPSLKISFNNVFGYYFEVRNTHKDKVPETWTRKQTLVNAERYITEELKVYEEKILQAESAILGLETELYAGVCNELLRNLAEIQFNCRIIAQLDVLVGFSILAEDNQYTQPKITHDSILEIKEGRHPVIEKLLPIGENYIPNDVFLDPKKQQILMITGPNMSGKSALLRQTALITILAQMGSFVPAKYAKIGLVDQVFTRVGASDNISQGESTFMVEMNETANILNNISENSLILLDEIGRGTSTFDGISIAWSIAEYLHESKMQPKTLFATHYHELNEMTNTYPKIKNFNVSIKELNGEIHFVRTLQPGGSEHSFGIHVAKIAGMPTSLTQRAEEILVTLEGNTARKSLSDKTKKLTEENMQLSFFQLDDPVLQNIREELLKTDLNILTPIDAMMKLHYIKKLLGE